MEKKGLYVVLYCLILMILISLRSIKIFIFEREFYKCSVIVNIIINKILLYNFCLKIIFFINS